jgi:methionine-rich copper-binding protein CopC
MNTTRIAVAWLVFVAAVTGTPAAAHAFLDRASPAVGSTVHESPASVRLSFSEALEPAFSRAHVEDATGKIVDAGGGHVDAADRTIVAVDVPPLPPGTYRVRWRVVSIDTHVTEGDYTFTIAK